MKHILIITAILFAGCSKEQDLCKCKVEYQTTRTGQWRTESVREVPQYNGSCDDRTDVIVWPVVIGTTSGTVYSSNGIREKIDCD